MDPTQLLEMCSLLDSDDLQKEDIEDDIDGERETLPDLKDSDKVSLLDPQIASLWRQSITGASKGITEETDDSYERLAKQCANYLVENQFIQAPEQFFCKNPPKDSPFYIISWIMNECNDRRPLDGTQKPPDAKRGTYSHAQKLRASMTHTFGRIYELGSAVWSENPETGATSGNPSVSRQVSAYMVSLRNRKTRAGETPTSARAITSEVLKQLYNFNHKTENWEQQPFQGPRSRLAAQLDQWGGPMARRELQAIYTIAFLCLLRSDEVLKIKREHVVLSKDPDTITLTLHIPM